MRFIGYLIFIIILYTLVSGLRLFYVIQTREIRPEVIKSVAIGDGKIIKMAVAGDSTAAGYGAKNGEEAFPYLIAENFARKYLVQYSNLAISGATTSDLIAYQLPKIIDEDPDVVIISIGANDATHFVDDQLIIRNYQQVIDQLNQNTHARVYLTNIPTFKDTNIVIFPFPQLWDKKAERLNTTINALGTGKVTIVDIHSVEAALSPDAFHPSSTGYRAWADQFLSQIGDQPF